MQARAAMICRVLAFASCALVMAQLHPPPAAAQQGSRVETVQVRDERRPDSNATGKAYLDAPSSADTAPVRRNQTSSAQIPGQNPSRETTQISVNNQRGSAMAQLSQAELEATLAQLSATERRVLQDAIAGTDICDNPPEVAAIRALCANRIETRANEFGDREPEAVSAEESLLRGGLDKNNAPNVVQVIQRLSRTSTAADNFNNQEIASIALAPPPEQIGTEEEAGALSNLPPGTEGIINAIINQLGGGAGGAGGAGGP